MAEKSEEKLIQSPSIYSCVPQQQVVGILYIAFDGDDDDDNNSPINNLLWQFKCVYSECDDFEIGIWLRLDECGRAQSGIVRPGSNDGHRFNLIYRKFLCLIESNIYSNNYCSIGVRSHGQCQFRLLPQTTAQRPNTTRNRLPMNW